MTDPSPLSPTQSSQRAPRKAGWPLVALACCSFIPVLGFFAAAAAVTWALLTDRPRVKAAIVIASIGALLHVAAVVVFAVIGAGSEEYALERTRQARRDLERIVTELESHKGSRGEYPRTLELLIGMPVPVRFINIYDQTAGIFSQRPYRYVLSPDGSAYDLFAVGLDGEEGTGDDIRPILEDSVQARSGFRPRP